MAVLKPAVRSGKQYWTQLVLVVHWCPKLNIKSFGPCVPKAFYIIIIIVLSPLNAEGVAER